MNTSLTEPTIAQPRLQAPGTGLPSVEARFFKHGLPLLSKTISRAAARRIFLREGNRILYLAQDLEDWELEERVLVKRPFGVEDSSRHWSMALLMEHLMVSGVLVHKILRQLSMGVRPHWRPSIAAGKPKGERGPRIRQDFDRFLEKFVEATDALEFSPKPTLSHPWTAEMNASQWFKFSALHHWMHRIHAERIVEGIE
ncbi:MAG: hypothetical protein GWO24_17605 [Akkermansiaceae bacterium]|nr:hypothetical protein [Akkermansiaceae bacterium]